jgi:hypothetical protein
MKKRVVELTSHELNNLAIEAWGDAARKALSEGRAVTGSRDGRRFRYHPDGKVEDLGPVHSLSERRPKKIPASRKSVA